MYPSPMPSQFSNSNRQIFDTHGPSLRVYQVWKGRNRFFLGGRLVFGPDARSLFITILLISAPVILFCTVVFQELVKELPRRIGNLILLLSAVVTIYIIILLLLTSGRDPGIIPRNPYPPLAEDEGDASSSISTEWASCQSVVPTLPPTKDVTVNGIVVKVKYCQTCMLYRPPRCSHCSICNNCVERFDHHCPWVGQCIGKRNYRFFFMFVSSTTFLCLYVFAMCWVNIKHIMKARHCSLWKALMKSPLSGILILYTFVAAWFVGGLTLFHLYLIFTNQTTYENFRYKYDRNTNPYNQGCFLNAVDIFFSKIPSSKNKFREKVKGVSSPVFTPSMSSVCRGLSPEVVKMTSSSSEIERGKTRVVCVEEFEEDMQKRHIESQTNWDEKDNWV